MTHPITVPLELVEKWGHDANLSGVPYNDEHWAYEQHIATRAAQWGADQELEACLRLVEIDAGEDAYDFARYIRAARRPEPKPPSLKEQALKELAWVGEHLDMPLHNYCNAIHTIQRALEQLDD
jgi:hypothetical protein